MPKFLLRASYTAEGVKGVMKEGGTKRQAAVKSLIESNGGSLEAFYFAYGEDDAIIICDFPSAATALGISMAVGATGLVTLSTTPLITPKEVDEAAKIKVAYRGPGTS